MLAGPNMLHGPNIPEGPNTLTARLEATQQTTDEGQTAAAPQQAADKRQTAAAPSQQITDKGQTYLGDVSRGIGWHYAHDSSSPRFVGMQNNSQSP